MITVSVLIRVSFFLAQCDWNKRITLSIECFRFPDSLHGVAHPAPHMKTFPTLLPSHLVFFALSLAPLVPATADVTVSGRVGPSVINDNIIVERGGKCVLNGTIIKGNVMVRPGAWLVAYGATIEGSVRAEATSRVELRSRTKVDGDFQGNATRHLAALYGTRIAGGIRLDSADTPRNSRPLAVNHATVSGDVLVTKSPGQINVRSSDIGGNLILTGNLDGHYHLTANRVDEDVQVLENLGKVSVIGNRVIGDLQVTANERRPIVRNNRVVGTTVIE
jgi:hypothetical protein